MVASHHHLSVKDDVETEDDRPDDGEHQPHCSSLREQSPIIYLLSSGVLKVYFKMPSSGVLKVPFKMPSSDVLKVHIKMSRLVSTCGKNKATKPARQKTTSTQSNAPDTQSMIT